MSKNVKIIVSVIIFGLIGWTGMILSLINHNLSAVQKPTVQSENTSFKEVNGASTTTSSLIAKPSITPTVVVTLTPTPTIHVVSTKSNALTPTKTVIQSLPPTSAQSSGLSNDNHYINSAGNEVHSPAYSNDGNVPAGATARCNDGTYSFSQSHRGTCSRHGGVAAWL